MAPEHGANLQRLIQGSEELIRELELGTGAADSLALVRAAEAHVDGEPAVSLESFSEVSADGTVVVEVSPDSMEARASFHPPVGKGNFLTLEDAEHLIDVRGITFGVDWEAVKGCILTCNEERIDIPDVVIARGKAPVAEAPEFLVLSDRLVTPLKREGPAGPRVDFKELSIFTLVRKGEVLAELQPKREGVMGTNVRGAAVSFSRERTSYPRPGRNTQWSDGNVVASCDGRFQLNADSFWVDEVLDIVGSVDLRVGNIDFPGDVVIRGEIRDGFTVKAGKSMFCVGCIGAARVVCGGDLVTQQGVVGKDKAVILVGGAVEAKFLEGCAVDAGGAVRIRTSVLNSTVHTGDRLELGERGIVIGGIIKAQNGVSAAQIGTDRGPRTEIYCGVDFKVEQKLVWIRDRGIALANRLREVENRIKTDPRVGPVLEPLRVRIKTAIHKLNESARTLVVGLDRNEQAEVVAYGTVFPGAYLEICHISHFLTRPVHRVSFRLDKAGGRIVESRWEPSSGARKSRAPGAAAAVAAPGDARTFPRASPTASPSARRPRPAARS